LFERGQVVCLPIEVMIDHDLSLCTSILRLALAGRFRFWDLVSFPKRLLSENPSGFCLITPR
jgi:hypothetical protein